MAWFRPAGRVTFFKRRTAGPKKVSKNACRCIRTRRPRFAALDFPHSTAAPRVAAQGHPWLFTALAASMPLAPLRSDSIRPSDGAFWRRLLGRAWEQAKRFCFYRCLKIFRRLGLESPSEGRTQALRRGTRGMDAERGVMGQGWPFVRGRLVRPPERRRSEGSFAKQNPDVGVAFFLVTFSWPNKKK